MDLDQIKLEMPYSVFQELREENERLTKRYEEHLDELTYLVLQARYNLLVFDEKVTDRCGTDITYFMVDVPLVLRDEISMKLGVLEYVYNNQLDFLMFLDPDSAKQIKALKTAEQCERLMKILMDQKLASQEKTKNWLKILKNM